MGVETRSQMASRCNGNASHSKTALKDKATSTKKKTKGGGGGWGEWGEHLSIPRRHSDRHKQRRRERERARV